MKLKTVKSEGIAHSSYFLFDGGEAVVVDPCRDCEIYTRLSQKECMKIRYSLLGWTTRQHSAASILKKQGFHEVYNVLGGMTAWTKLGYPTVK